MYIIDPSFIYWMNVLNSFRGFALFVLIVGIILGIMFTTFHFIPTDVDCYNSRIDETYSTFSYLANSLESASYNFTHKDDYMLKTNIGNVNKYFDKLKKQIDASKKWKKLAIISFCVVGVCILIRMFVPSRDTMIEIMIAKTATVENVTNGVNFTVDTFKEIVDYIVNAISSLN